MTETTHTHNADREFLTRVDRAWLFILLILLVVALWLPAALVPMVSFALDAFYGTAGFIAFAVIAVGALKASGAEATLARAFEGRETRMILLAAVLGGISPFCSCEVIPFIAALLALGVPLSAVMAFWLASPLMDPAMFLITSGTLGLDFAVAKTIAAVSLGLFGGFGVRVISVSGVFNDPLKKVKASGCGCGSDPFTGKPVWAFWRESERRTVFWREALANGLFLTKWLVLAYLLEALMIRYVPASWIAGVLGGDGIAPVFLGAALGGPAYLNGYAAVPLVAGMLEQGMSQGAAMAFVLAGGVSCIPAAIAVWALVKPRVFFAYLAFAFTGSVIAGFAWMGVLAV